MAKFDGATLHELRDVQEVAISTDKHPKSAVVIWVVVADNEVFVRSWRRRQRTLVSRSRDRWRRDA